MRNLFLLISFFTITPILLLASIILLAFHDYTLNTTTNHFIPLSSKLTVSTITYAALPSTETQLSGSVGTSDTRVARITAFFHLYGSVLEKYSQNIVDASDKYNIDYRYLPAIAAQESLACKQEIPGTNNCWGFGIYTHHTTSFESYPQAIDTISKALAQNYINKGYNTLEQIQKIWNPLNTNNWSGNVNYFMNQLQNIL